MFVRAVEGQYASLGVGKRISRHGMTCSVEYFDAPTSVPLICEIDERVLESVPIAQQTRIYHFDEVMGVWQIGRLLDDHGQSQLVQFPNSISKHLKSDAVFVRWARPIQDPTPFLANRINESPRFSDGRSAFIRSQIRQRAASMGMSSLLACAVELEAHQLEVVRRILQDPVQRYLLADEVGLGKTVEAGVLIRQCVLDFEHECAVLVLVPEALVSQWRAELSTKFFLGRCLDRSVHVIAFHDGDKILEMLPRATMLVIDEAHHLTTRGPGEAKTFYAEIARAAPTIERVLLLSATPALHNQRGFLEMLHLLDPSTYPLDGEEGFRRKIEGRQALAEIVAGLTPENALYLDYTVDQLAALFPDDLLLQEHGEALRAVLETMPAEDDPALVEAVARVHTHLSEVYRLHRRILRHRRRSVAGLTPNRSGAEIVRYRSGDRATLTAAMDDWRFGEATSLDAAGSEAPWAERVRVFWQVLDRASQFPSSGAGTIGFLARRTTIVGDPNRFASIGRCLERAGLFDDRADALIGAVRVLLNGKAQCIVFCSDIRTADDLAKRIAGELGVGVARHDPDDGSWMTFGDDRPVLVCDRRAEEGLNLQGGKKVVVHYDLPLNPNRIEQRLGRADRYGSGQAVRSLVLACEDDPIEMAWVTYLDRALQVFDRSIASLQYLLDKMVRAIARPLFTDGPEALADLTARSVGANGLIESEIKAINQQDALDALGTPPTDLADDLSEVDEDWQSLTRDTAPWLEQMLQFDRVDEPRHGTNIGPSAPFRYVYSTANRRTLVPLSSFMSHCSSALDLDLSPRGGRTLRTIPYTFRRRTALHRNARADGVGLLRYGDALISGMTALTQADDRGRSFAMWRFMPDHVGDPLADIFFRFDFILEADVTDANRVLGEHGRETRSAGAAIRRRGDMALPPFHRSIWLDRELALVSDPALLDRLARPYSVEPDRSGALDLNLNPRRWENLVRLSLPELASWSDLCLKARSAAEAELRGDRDLVERLAEAERRASRVDDGRLGQLRARACTGATAEEDAELVFEAQLAAALRQGIRSPKVRVDAAGTIFTSASRPATDRVSGGL